MLENSFFVTALLSFREAVRVVVQDLTQTLTKDIKKRMCETLGFYLLDKWWAEQEQKYKEKVRHNTIGDI